MLDAGGVSLDAASFASWDLEGDRKIPWEARSVDRALISTQLEFARSLQSRAAMSRENGYPLRIQRIQTERGRKVRIGEFKEVSNLMPLGGPYHEGCGKYVMMVRAFEPETAPPRYLSASAVRRFIRSRDTRTPHVRPLRDYDRPENIQEFIGVFPCGKCPLCCLRKRAQARTNILLEVEHAMANGRPVTFWSQTLDSERLHRGRTSQKSEMKWVKKDLGRGMASRQLGQSTEFVWAEYHREEMPGEAFRHLQYEWRRELQRCVPGLTIVTVVEPHKDGVPHGHALVIGFDPEAEMGTTSDTNDYDNPVWTKHKGFEHWPHGRCEIVLVKEQQEQVAHYISKYAAKGFDIDPAVLEYRADIDGDFWTKNLIGWPRKPGCGLRHVVERAQQNAEQLAAEGYAVFRDYPLDPYRRRLAQETVYKATGLHIPRSLDVSEQLVASMLGAEAAYELFAERKEMMDAHGF